MFRKKSNFHTLPVKELVKGTPYKEGDLVFAKNKKAKVYWPAKVIEVQRKNCRIEFFATKEVVSRPIKKIFPYEENKQRVKNHEAESLFYQAWRDIKVEAESDSKIFKDPQGPDRKRKKRKVKRREKTPEENSDNYWDTTTFYDKSDSDSSSENVKHAKRKTRKKKCSKRKAQMSDESNSSESNYSAIVHFTRSESKPCVSGYEEKRHDSKAKNYEKHHKKDGHRGKKKAGSSSKHKKHCHHGKSSKKRHH